MDKSVKRPYKIEYFSEDTGGGLCRWFFRISPLVADSGMFLFNSYGLVEAVEKKDENKMERVAKARTLRGLHRACWTRYHKWRQGVHASGDD